MISLNNSKLYESNLQLLDDYLWFKDNYTKFQKEYGSSFLAIKNKQVIGKFDTYADGVRSISKIEEIGTFIIQECQPTHEAYKYYFL